jgi:hypothetical protein
LFSINTKKEKNKHTTTKIEWPRKRKKKEIGLKKTKWVA